LINIISGTTEAEYAYLGVTSSLQNPGKTIIIDIGGGSTEVIAGENKNILFSRSFNTGVVSSSEHFRNSSNFNEDIKNHFKSIFRELKNSELKADTCFAIAGTPTTLAAVKLNLREFNADKVEGTIVNSEDITAFVKSYSEDSEYYLDEYKNILSGREDLIIPGSLILLTIMQKLGMDEIIVSTRGIRHGAVINYLKSQG
jgi:exopolyphosphatase / guanosine-5'-triphosphate,3'-diphosphate pyrophosphatase